MTTALLNDFLKLKIETNDPEEKFITSGVSWAAYESLITSLGNTNSYRVAYLRETLEIMSPSRGHELDKENLGRLLEAYLEEYRIRFWDLVQLLSKAKTSKQENNQISAIVSNPTKIFLI